MEPEARRVSHLTAGVAVLLLLAAVVTAEVQPRRPAQLLLHPLLIEARIQVPVMWRTIVEAREVKRVFTTSGSRSTAVKGPCHSLLTDVITQACACKSPIPWNPAMIAAQREADS